MPLYKFVGNQILTTFQNRLVGLDLSEWHSGYRAYRVDALADLDLDVVLRRLRLRHRDHPRAARGREADRRGADPDLLRRRDLLRQRHAATPRTSPRDVLRYRARRMGFGERRDPAGVDADAYELKPSAHSSHGVLLRWLAAAPAGAGARRRLLRRPVRRRWRAATATTSPASTWSSTRGSPSGSTRSSRPTSTTACPPRPATTIDVVVAGDILEHVVDPQRLLARPRSTGSPAAARSSSRSRTSATGTRAARVAVGRFDYDQRGPLDHGHVRFFTRRTLRAPGRRRAGCAIVERAHGRLPVRRARPRRRRRPRRAARSAGSAAVDRAATRAWPTLFGYQFLYRLERA